MHWGLASSHLTLRVYTQISFRTGTQQVLESSYSACPVYFVSYDPVIGYLEWKVLLTSTPTVTLAAVWASWMSRGSLKPSLVNPSSHLRIFDSSERYLLKYLEIFCYHHEDDNQCSDHASFASAEATPSSYLEDDLRFSVCNQYLVRKEHLLAKCAIIPQTVDRYLK